jgi:hypothetical protein
MIMAIKHFYLTGVAYVEVNRKKGLLIMAGLAQDRGILSQAFSS